MSYPPEQLGKRLQKEYKMDCRVLPLGQDVSFFGTELECYKMAYMFKNKENRVVFSTNLNTWTITFPEWFSVEFSQQIQ